MKGILCKPWKIKAIASSHDKEWQTRRLIQNQPTEMDKCYETAFKKDFGGRVPRYHVGEIVYIKEGYSHWCTIYHQGYAFALVRYSDASTRQFAFTGDPPKQKWWNTGKPLNYIQNPRTMPAWAARYHIRITDVRAERTKDISPEDCGSEGILPMGDYEYGWNGTERRYRTPELAYFALYDSINGKGAHERNWDWVYTFVKEGQLNAYNTYQAQTK